MPWPLVFFHMAVWIPMKQFFIVESKNNLLVGRNGDHELHIGDEFNKLVLYKHFYDAKRDMIDAGVEETKQINYKITSIVAYDRELEFLGAGMTGLLVLEGEGELKQDWVLE